MASVNWQKTNTVKLARMGCHFDNSKRMDCNHSNQDINKSLTGNNYYLGAGSYKEIMEHSKEYIMEVDRQFPPKKKQKAEDRITMVSLDIPCPRTITDMGLSEEFFKNINIILENKYSNAYIGAAIHVDEIHNYYDPSIKQTVTSCEHAHAWVCCHAKWQDKNGERQGINGKNFVTKQAMVSLNNAIHTMCIQQFGTPYLTGGEARNINVERLKQESYTALKTETRNMRRGIITLTNERNELTRENEYLQEKIKTLEGQFERLEGKLKSKELELNIKTEAYERLKIEYDQLLDDTVERKEQKEISRWNRENAWGRSVEYER